MLCLSGGNFLGWFKFDKVYDFSNNINSAVYSFAVVEEVPSNNLLPFNIEETFYIGESGGQDPTWDRKNKDSGRGRIQTSFHMRMKAHSVMLVRDITSMISSNQFVAIAIFVPKDTSNMDYCKAWQKSVESELICYYSLMFGSSPEFNLAHKSNATKKRLNPNSISQKVITELKQQSLEKHFL
jgi:hypothetical protein